MPASLVLCLALFGISFAGPLVRLSNAHPLAIAIWRIGLSLIIVALPDVLVRSGIESPRALLGDGLALAGAVTAACYFAAGRRVRSTLDLRPYVGLVYGTCFVVLIAFAAVVRAPVLGQPPRELAIFLALAIGPMLLGHTALNWALKYLPAYVVNLTLLGEPVGATILAAQLPGIREVPGELILVGGAIILAGICVTARTARPSISRRLPD